MSVLIDNTEDLLALLKKLGVKVTSVGDVRELLTTINATYNPDAARQKTGKLIGVAVPGIMAGAAATISVFLSGHEVTPYTVGALALIWGATTLVSTAAVIASAILTSGRGGRPILDTPAQLPPSRLQSSLTGITNEPPR